jgi:hypothetical protein
MLCETQLFGCPTAIKKGWADYHPDYHPEGFNVACPVGHAKWHKMLASPICDKVEIGGNSDGKDMPACDLAAP